MTSFEDAHRRLEEVHARIAKVLLGKDEEIRLVLMGFAAGGHVLLEDVPGVGKTVLARAIARAIRGTFARVQCTPDLLPSDVTGTNVYDPREMVFHFRPGPIFQHVVLVDEINRATPRTQAALLEAMEERQVSIDGGTHTLPEAFFVLATQNPVEMEGTFPLPEAQLDRFFLRARLGYPDHETEIRILEAFERAHPLDGLEPVLDVAEWMAIRSAVREVPVSRPVRGYVASIVEATRKSEDLDLGASPRAALALQRAGQARALLRSARPYVTPQDVKDLAGAVLGHRLMLKTRTRLAGLDEGRILERLLRSIPVPLQPEESPPP